MANDIFTQETVDKLNASALTFNEVVTSRVGGVSTGAIIDQTLTPLGETTDTLKGRLDKIGTTFTDWGSTEGGTLTSASQAFLNNTVGSAGIGNYYAWTGAFPHTVMPGIDPAITAGYAIRSNAQFFSVVGQTNDGASVSEPSLDDLRDIMRRDTAGYVLIGNTTIGCTVTAERQTVKVLATGNEYEWTGSLPKVVAPGTDPTADPLWVPRTDVLLRSQLTGGGSLAMPYAVINVDLPPYNGDLGAAIDAAPAGTTLLLGNRDYNIVGKFRLDTVAFPAGNWSGIEKKNIKIVGSGMPELSPDESRFVSGSGTVIQGALINFADGFECWNLGVDVGGYVVDNLAGGTHMEGFVPGTHKLNTAWSDAESAYINDVHFGNIKILLKQPVTGNPATEKHACLVERIDGGSNGYVECIGGTHGYVMKSRNFHRNGVVRCWRQVNDAAIFKTDAFTECGTSHGGTLVVGKEGHAIRTGKVLFQAANGTRLKSVSFHYVGVNCSGLERVYDGSTTRLEDVSILSAYVDGSDATAITIPSIGDRWHVGEHTIKNAPYGIGAESGCIQCTIGDGSVTMASVDGYRLAGDIQHGVLSAKSCGGYGVQNNGCVVNPSRINGADNVSGNLSGLFNATGFLTIQNGWLNASDGGTFGADIYDGKIVMRGRLGSGTGNVLFVVSAGFRPRTDKWFCVTGHNGTVRVAAFIHVVASTGQVILDDYATFAGGAAAGVAMDGIAWEYL